MSQTETIKKAVSEEVKRLNASMAEHERIMRFRLVPESWSPATGELSASLKLKRRNIEARYKELIDKIYLK